MAYEVFHVPLISTKFAFVPMSEHGMHVMIGDACIDSQTEHQSFTPSCSTDLPTQSFDMGVCDSQFSRSFGFATVTFPLLFARQLQ